MRNYILNENPNIWEFDVDDTLICWDLSKYPNHPRITIDHKNGPVTLVAHQKNINLLIKLHKIGWHIRVHSGSGHEWAEAVIRALMLEKHVDDIEAKPRGRTDDKPPGDGLAYDCFRELDTGLES